jgi:hypothetical protein
MEESQASQLRKMEEKIDAVYKVVEKMRRYYLITMWVTIFFLVAPLVAGVFVIPFFLNSYIGTLIADDSSPESILDVAQFDVLKELLQ